ncbi:hypothetical protein [Streptomyces sp. NPDC059466]|uniref:hypothetical protein n=1 Tax=unclassified Streptomyces TaxID=2593676 RepID=UPI0036A38FD5
MTDRTPPARATADSPAGPVVTVTRRERRLRLLKALLLTALSLAAFAAELLLLALRSPGRRRSSGGDIGWDAGGCGGGNDGGCGG